ncbi:hypothetical protein NL676_020776 [Syzygium grande]|nr:hypothetical protein NL676_020776 [Syzygium grande]
MARLAIANLLPLQKIWRVADLNEDALEALYEKRLKKKALQTAEEEEAEPGIQVGPLDSLPVKTMPFCLLAISVESIQNHLKMKINKSKKEAKNQAKELPPDEVRDDPQRAMSAELKEDITAEESFETKKCKLGELGIATPADPESNFKLLKRKCSRCAVDDYYAIVELGLLSLLAVFEDIIPGYHTRLPTVKELEMIVSRDVEKMQYYESTLLSAYKLQMLFLIEDGQCLC